MRFMFSVCALFIGLATARRTYAYHLTSDHHILGLSNSPAVRHVHEVLLVAVFDHTLVLLVGNSRRQIKRYVCNRLIGGCI